MPSPPAPVFALLVFTSGSYEGAVIRDLRLADELHRRGYPVHIYWMMETNASLVKEKIPQRLLCRGQRYQRSKPSGLFDAAGQLLRLYPAQRRRRFVQQHPDYLNRLTCHFINAVCDGDPALEARLEQWLIRDGVTHLLPTFAMTCPFAQAVKARGRHAFDYLVTFQGEEIFANYAQQIGRAADYYRRLRDAAAASGWKAIAVSLDYIARLHAEMGLDVDRTVAIHPGIDLPDTTSPPPFEALLTKLPELRPDVPIITYFGRQDSEKGIDLLLYAARMLQERKVPFQLVACGGSSFGLRYREVCEEIARHLRVRVMWKRRVSDDLRAALYTHSRCIVYPSIHREPFGMVAPEAMSHGTPVVVPNYGGITEAIRVDGKSGGLTFKVWDTADLASTLERLITDDTLHAELSHNAKQIAPTFSVANMTDRILTHLGITP